MKVANHFFHKSGFSGIFDNLIEWQAVITDEKKGDAYIGMTMTWFCWCLVHEFVSFGVFFLETICKFELIRVVPQANSQNFTQNQGGDKGPGYQNLSSSSGISLKYLLIFLVMYDFVFDN